VTVLQAVEGTDVVGIVVVSHSAELARGVAELAGQMAGPGVRIEVAGGGPQGTLGTDDGLVRDAIRRADQGAGVLVLGDLGSAILTIRHVLENQSNGQVRLADAPLVEGAISAAVIASTGSPLADVARAAEEARGASKL
jgi:PTS hybrid protein